MRLGSITRRVAAAATVVLAVFVLLTAVTLEQAFRDSARSAREERLLGQLYLLMAQAEVDAAGALTLPATLPEARFSLPGSGLYAHVTDGAGHLVWHSASAVGIEVPLETRLAPGRKRFAEAHGGAGKEFFVYGFGVDWNVGGKTYPFTFSVAEDLTAFHAQLTAYRHSLWGWLGVMALLLLAAQAALLTWGLRPLRAVAGELQDIEAGRSEALSGRYPSEIQGLTDGLNVLLAHERARQRRYRDALADLAHSLKTPLAVLRGALGDDARQLPDTVASEVARMDRIVDYQLRRAATEGAAARFASALPVAPLARRIVESLGKVYRDKGVTAEVAMADGVRFRGDEGDLMELLGNLVDNAYKWCRQRVRVSAEADGQWLRLCVADDGPGIPEGEAERLLQRGARADQATPGHGIGLAVVRDIAQAYGGDLVLDRSDLGGAGIHLRLPLA